MRLPVFDGSGFDGLDQQQLLGYARNPAIGGVVAALKGFLALMGVGR